MTKLVLLYFLNIGDRFEYPELNSMRNLQVARISESGTGIKGEYFDGELWRPLSANYTVSNGTLVKQL